MNQDFAKNPYVGPRAFQSGEKIYGRGWEMRRLINLIRSERIVLLHSPSGAGKSSLIQAAILPELEQKKQFDVLPTIRVNRSPTGDTPVPDGANRYTVSTIVSLEKSREDDKGQDESHLWSLTLTEYFRLRWSGEEEERQLLVFDQFEEIINQDPYDLEMKEQFFNQLGALLSDRNRYALFLIRDDYLASLEPYSHLIPTHLRTTLRLELLDHEAALKAIRNPAINEGVEFDEKAARSLVEDLSKVRVQKLDGTMETRVGPFVEPVQLQVVCNRLWSRVSAAKRLSDGIDQRDVKDFGEVSNALAGYYCDTIGRVAREQGINERDIRHWIESQLITEQGIRGQVLKEHDETQGLSNSVIEGLVSTHLLRQEKRRQATWLELAHDRLVEPILQDNRRVAEARRARIRTAVVLLLLAVVFIIGALFAGTTLRSNSLASSRGQATGTYVAREVRTTEQAFAAATAARVQADQDLLQIESGATRMVAQVTAEAQVIEATATQFLYQVTQQASEARATATQEAYQFQATANLASLALLPIETLRGMLTGADATQRAAAAEALGVAATANPELSAEVVPLLFARLSGDSDASVRTAAAMSLLDIAAVDVTTVTKAVESQLASTETSDLLTAAEDSEPIIRQTAAVLLGQTALSLQDGYALEKIEATLTNLSADPVNAVRVAAEESSNLIKPVGSEVFVGEWVNVDPETRSWTRIEIGPAGNDLSFHLYGSCGLKECDAGETIVPYGGGPLVVQLDSDFSTRTLTVTVNTKSDMLRAETFVHFDDYSGRSDYNTSDLFVRRSQITTTAVPTPTTLPVGLESGDKLFVALFWDEEGLAIVDLKSEIVEKTTSFSAINARYLAANSVREEIYVSLANGDSFYIVDGGSGEVIGVINEEVGWNSQNSVVSPAGDDVFLATSGGTKGREENKILIIDPEKIEVTQVIRLGAFEFPGGLGRLELSPDGRQLYTIDLTAEELIVVDALAGEVTNRIPVPYKQILGISENGDFLYVLHGNELVKVSITGWRELWRFKVGERVDKVAVAPGIIYVPDQEGDRVILINDRTADVMARWPIDAPSSVVLSEDFRDLFVSSIENDSIQVIDAKSGATTAVINLPEALGPTDMVLLTIE